MDRKEFLELIEEYGEQMYYLRTVRSWDNPKLEDEVNEEIDKLTKKIKAIVNHSYVEWICPCCNISGAEVEFKGDNIKCGFCNTTTKIFE